MASYTVTRSFATLTKWEQGHRTKSFREGDVVMLSEKDAASYVKLGWLEPIKVVKKREHKKDSRANG